MTDALCFYGGGAVGKLMTAELLDAGTRYDFMPNRSKSHLDLGARFRSDGQAPIEVEWEGRRVAMIVTSLEARSITLRKGK